jgi:glucosamine 6-phosphate synthetase-like amidotransferase/phosphosugar isomerase protein
MCGIFGHFSLEPLRRKHLVTLREAARSQVMRGQDAFGIAWCSASGIDSHKQQGSIADHLQHMKLGIGSVAMIGHTRMATHGCPSENMNNHPHRFAMQNSPAYLVHNGVISNYAEICRLRGLTMTTECDSEVLARHMEDGRGGILNRVKAAVRDIDPYAPFAAAILTPNYIILARRGNPLYWSETQSQRWFASTHHGLTGKHWLVPDNTAFSISLNSGEVATIELDKRIPSTMRFLGSDLFTRGNK